MILNIFDFIQIQSYPLLKYKPFNPQNTNPKKINNSSVTLAQQKTHTTPETIPQNTHNFAKSIMRTTCTLYFAENQIKSAPKHPAKLPKAENAPNRRRKYSLNPDCGFKRCAGVEETMGAEEVDCELMLWREIVVVRLWLWV